MTSPSQVATLLVSLGSDTLALPTNHKHGGNSLERLSDADSERAWFSEHKKKHHKAVPKNKPDKSSHHNNIVELGHGPTMDLERDDDGALDMTTVQTVGCCHPQLASLNPLRQPSAACAQLLLRLPSSRAAAAISELLDVTPHAPLDGWGRTARLRRPPRRQLKAPAPPTPALPPRPAPARRASRQA